MEHNLLIMETCVNRFCPRLPMSDIQASPKPGGEREKKERLRARARGAKRAGLCSQKRELRSTTVWKTEEQH